jgi:4-hydroxy-tetrahydrodipicolinate reductase
MRTKAEKRTGKPAIKTVGLIGYGRAGKAVSRVLADAEDVDLRWLVKHFPPSEADLATTQVPFLPSQQLATGEIFEQYPVDFVIDFSAPETILSYGKHAADRGTGIVSAISNYPVETNDLFRELACQIVVMNSPNITLGINYLLVASQLLQHIAPFTDIEVIEEHFRDKAERSGTAMRIAETLGLDETKINSIRVGGIVGHHEVVFGFPFQTVRLVHDSISREAFGTGALFALRQLHNRSAGLYSYESILREAMLDALRQPCQ